jgi:hypothetical protein
VGANDWLIIGAVFFSVWLLLTVGPAFIIRFTADSMWLGAPEDQQARLQLAAVLVRVFRWVSGILCVVSVAIAAVKLI